MKTRMVSLNRKTITGRIDQNTPLVVLLEIAEAHGIDPYQNKDTSHNLYNSLILGIRNIECPKINLNKVNDGISNIEFSYLARFINNQVAWSKNNILQAWEFLSKFTSNTKVRISENFSIGQQTPNSPGSYNACVLYKICRQNNIQTNKDMSMETMGQLVKTLLLPKEVILLKLESSLNSCTKEQLISMIAASGINIISNTKKRDMNELLYHISIQNVINYKPKRCDNMFNLNATDAICLGGLNFKIDLSQCSDPVNEYIYYSRYGKFSDPWILGWKNRNPKLFDLRFCFNPLFSDRYYSASDMSSMAINSGYKASEIILSDVYELLRENDLCNNFYRGLRYPLKSDVTEIGLLEIDNLKYEETIVYGNSVDGYNCFTKDELISMLEHNRDFRCPCGDGVMSETAISCLGMMIEDEELINEVQRLLDTADKEVREFKEYYFGLNEDRRMIIAGKMRGILELGMVIRGWDGVGGYPMESLLVDSRMVEMEVARRIIEIDGWGDGDDGVGEVGKIVLGLPLFTYGSGSGFILADKDEGGNVNGKIKLMSEGENGNIKSCIRMSSNYLIYSMCKYFMEIGIDCGVDCSLMSRIF